MVNRIEIQNAGFSYDGKRYVWENIDLTVKDGDCFCLLGVNGCGKTTLLNCIARNMPLSMGKILINGRDITEYSVMEFARTVGVVYQDHTVSFPYSSLEVVRMGRTPHLGLFQTPSEEDTNLAVDIMDELGILHLADKSYSQISGGERQLVLIARTLCQQPEMILFDEPTSHLDFKNQAMVIKTMKKLSEKGMTLVMTSHFPNHVWNVGTSAALMGEGGIIASGNCEEIMTKENLERTYGVPVKILESISDGKSTFFCEPSMDF